MKLFLIAALILCSFAAYSQTYVAQDSALYFTMSTNIAGSWSFTNDFTKPFKLDSASFGFSIATSSVSVAVIRRWQRPEYAQPEVVTNRFNDFETNSFSVVTNTWLVVTNYATTSVTNQIFGVTNLVTSTLCVGRESIADKWVLPGDILSFTIQHSPTSSIGFDAIGR